MRAWQIGRAAVIWTGIIKWRCTLRGRHSRIFQCRLHVVFGAAMYSYLGWRCCSAFSTNRLWSCRACDRRRVRARQRSITRWRIPPFSWPGSFPAGRRVWGRIHSYAMHVLVPDSVRGWAGRHSHGNGFAVMSVIAPWRSITFCRRSLLWRGRGGWRHYDARKIIFRMELNTRLRCRSLSKPGLRAHPPYKAMGARVSFSLWTPIFFMLIVASGLTISLRTFPLADSGAMIAYVSVGVGRQRCGASTGSTVSVLLLSFAPGSACAAALNPRPALSSWCESAVQEALNNPSTGSSLKGLAAVSYFWC